MMDLFEMAPTFDDPIGMLTACHRRIERALDVVHRIAEHEAEEALDRPTREALRQTLRYFATGVPRHAADEEESLFPRLRAAAERGEDPRGPSRRDLARALETLEMLESEHAAADAAHQELDTLGETLLETGRFKDPRDRVRFQELIALLRNLYRDHIRIEDEELFPIAARTVDTEGQERIGTEMAARRGIDRRQHLELVAVLESGPWARRAPQTMREAS